VFWSWPTSGTSGYFPADPFFTAPKSTVRVVLWKIVSSGLRFSQTVEGWPGDASNSIFTAAILAIADKP
jgi:hypothetical protein